MKKDYIIVGICLLAGLFIYLFYRTGKTVVNDLFINLITCDQFLSLQKSVASALPLPEHVIYSVPGGLWVFCVTLTSKPFFLKSGHLELPLHILPLIFSVGLELFQLFHFTNGRFDWFDIAVSLLGWKAAKSFFPKQCESQNFFCHITVSRIICVLTYLVVFLAHVWQ